MRLLATRKHKTLPCGITTINVRILHFFLLRQKFILWNRSEFKRIKKLSPDMTSHDGKHGSVIITEVRSVDFTYSRHLVLLCSAVTCFLSTSFGYTCGVFYIAILEKHRKSETATSWLGSLLNSFFCLGGNALYRSRDSNNLNNSSIRHNKSGNTCICYAY